MKITIGKPSLPPVTISGFQADFFMTYGGAKGDTERLITLNSVKGELLQDQSIKPLTLMAYCHERAAPRSFVVTSVKKLVAKDTGEVVGDIVAWLRANFPEEE